MLVGLGAPLANAANLVLLQKTRSRVDLVPAVFVGAVLSVLVMAPFAVPVRANLVDVGLLAGLGVFQLGLPCVLLVVAARHLLAAEIALLELLEVVFGPLWAWLGAGETPSNATLGGGAVVLAALVLNEAAGLRSERALARAAPSDPAQAGHAAAR
jgi:drug/metabolite transporter (DMT)-like permease